MAEGELLVPPRRTRLLVRLAAGLGALLVAAPGAWLALEQAWRAEVEGELARLEADGLLPAAELAAPDAGPLLGPLLEQLADDPRGETLATAFPRSIGELSAEPDGLRWLLEERAWPGPDADDDARDAALQADAARGVGTSFETREEVVAALRGVAAWLDRHEAALDGALARGARFGAAPRSDDALPWLHELQRLRQALLVRSAWRALERDANGAWADLARALGVVRLRDEPSMLTVSLQGRGLEELLRSISQTLRVTGPPGEVRAKALVEQLRALEGRDGLRRAFGGEVAFRLRASADELLGPREVHTDASWSTRTGLRARLLRERWRRSGAVQLAAGLRLVLAAPDDAPAAPLPALRELFAAGQETTGLLDVGWFPTLHERWLGTVARARLARAALALSAAGLRTPAPQELPLDPWRRGQRLRWDREGRGLVVWSVGPNAPTTRLRGGAALVVRLALPPAPPAPPAAPAPPPPGPVLGPATTREPGPEPAAEEAPARADPEAVDLALGEAERALEALYLLRLRALLGASAPAGEPALTADRMERALALLAPRAGASPLPGSAAGLARLRDDLWPRLADRSAFAPGAAPDDPERPASLVVIVADEARGELARARAEQQQGRTLAAPEGAPPGGRAALSDALRRVRAAAYVALARHVSIGEELDRARALLAREEGPAATKLAAALDRLAAAVDEASGLDGAAALRAALLPVDAAWAAIEEGLAGKKLAR